ncbi:hypothetical protein GCM10011608_50250 [Micromonospora sonchi]|uniref:Uncharacterized protein n=1 Tax=Micromonospora sonchi TaxID=1763543 RepID=A0A917U7Z5_9ACTN|nr:hypothetical protein [Micromonospora sonchi]GGM59137.1 hypothetical protein GCM10011608_50250 [Micromonospora sonchi]
MRLTGGLGHHKAALSRRFEAELDYHSVGSAGIAGSRRRAAGQLLEPVESLVESLGQVGDHVLASPRWHDAVDLIGHLEERHGAVVCRNFHIVGHLRALAYRWTSGCPV